MRLFLLSPLLLPVVLLAAAQEIKPLSEDELKRLPIATGETEVAKLLRSWWKEGTAAGNVGDWYDNRDGEHSPLDLSPWPQLQKVHYTPEMLKARVNWAAQRKLLPIVVFGNSSTSAPATGGGSNPIQYYMSPKGLAFLDSQYERNNLYIYPEHRDHDPGRNGVGPRGEEGYGDLYPTNSPYLITSQGSSGSDQPFMRAIPYVLAAFRPEVKAKLIATGRLMPTVQMIFRSSNKHLKNADEYLTAKAHPTVFEGGSVDTLKMVKAAHDMTLDTIPPRLRIKTFAEEVPKLGIDYFDPAADEKLGDTSSVIARVFRGKDRWRRMIVSAEGSADLDGKPLTFAWKVFRGDPQNVKITPKNEKGSVVEIAVASPVRRPIAPGSPMESNRVEIGVFASNGKTWSAPGFITWFGLDNETRTYDENDRIVEISSMGGDIRFKVLDWWKLLDKANDKWLPPLTKEQTAALAKLDKDKAEFHDRVKRPEGDPAVDTFIFKKYDDQVREFNDKQRRTFVENFDSHIAHLRQLTKSNLADNPDLKEREAKATDAQRKVVQTLQDKIKANEIAIDASAKDRPLLKGPTAFDREYEELLNSERLCQFVFPGIVQAERNVNYVDRRLSIPRKWRDVYLYDPKGQFVGWVRAQPDRKEPAYFTADGLYIAERDELGRCRKAKDVNLKVDAPGGQPKLDWSPGMVDIEYQYTGPDDRRGSIKKTP